LPNFVRWKINGGTKSNAVDDAGQTMKINVQTIHGDDREQFSGLNQYPDIVRGSVVIAVAHDAWDSSEVV
jgi:hypothetical protein